MSDRQLPSSFDGNTDFYSENRWAKLGRRLREEPLIPLGCALTCVALYKATRSIRTGNKEQTNRMFRARIYAQGFTLVAMLAGSYYYQDQRAAEKGVTVELAEQKARDKQQAWIRELEFRDREDREVRCCCCCGTAGAGADGARRSSRGQRSCPRGARRQRPESWLLTMMLLQRQKRRSYRRELCTIGSTNFFFQIRNLEIVGIITSQLIEQRIEMKRHPMIHTAPSNINLASSDNPQRQTVST